MEYLEFNKLLKVTGSQHIVLQTYLFSSIMLSTWMACDIWLCVYHPGLKFQHRAGASGQRDSKQKSVYMGSMSCLLSTVA